MKPSNPTPVAGTAAKVGGWIFALWSVLHIWVGAEGVHQYLKGGTSGLWNMLIGGRAVPRAAFVHATDPVTLFAQGQLILNFCLDVGALRQEHFHAIDVPAPRRSMQRRDPFLRTPGREAAA